MCIQNKIFTWEIIGDRQVAQWFRTPEVDLGKTPVEVKFGITRLSPPGLGLPTI